MYGVLRKWYGTKLVSCSNMGLFVHEANYGFFVHESNYRILNRAISQTNADLASTVYPDIRLRPISQEMCINLIRIICLEI